MDKTTFDSSSNEWVLLVDIVDAEDAFATGSPELKNTLIHELGHVLTLSTDQVDWDNPGISLDNESTEEDVSDFFLLQEDCVSGVLVQEGCLNEDSYFNQFFQAFWSQDVFDEHLNFILENTPEEAAENCIKHLRITTYPSMLQRIPEKISRSRGCILSYSMHPQEIV